MSVKFEKETVKTTEAVAGQAAEAMGKGKDDVLKNVGEALTKGGGPSGYLAVSKPRLQLQLALKPAFAPRALLTRPSHLRCT